MIAPPPEYDYALYLKSNLDLAPDSSAEWAFSHYKTYGAAEGRVCSAVDGRPSFQALVPRNGPILEIGPFCWPSFTKADTAVYFMDVLPKEELAQVARRLTGEQDPQVPDIDYVWRGEPYRDLIAKKRRGPGHFPVIFSAHNIEHQPCLVTHLRNVASIMTPDARMYLVVPDADYCFDHFMPETTIADVMEAYAMRRTRHSLRSVIEHRTLMCHNDAVRHWRGDHGENPTEGPVDAASVGLLKAATNEAQESDAYIDAHAWHFRPNGFRRIVDMIRHLGLSPLGVERVYPTLRNTNEFFAVLKMT